MDDSELMENQQKGLGCKNAKIVRELVRHLSLFKTT